MKIVDLRLCALFVGCIVIAACSQAMNLSRLPYTPNVDAVPDRGTSSPSYSVLYNFGAAPDGNGPSGELIDVSGRLYGTTYGGGKHNYGTVFSITTSGTETVLHSFGNGSDGQYPSAAMIDVKGTLYGTTSHGGAYGNGTVFSITRSGREKVLYAFGSNGPVDGSLPTSTLFEVGGKLYGTTLEGGVSDDGTVFSITTSGKEVVLHSFGSSGIDGQYPYAGLIEIKGTLYGSTESGGRLNCRYPAGGCGTVYSISSISTSDTEKVLHSFRGGRDGEIPWSGLTDVGGTLYGTTEWGGKPMGGTVFSITRSGKEKVLYAFGSNSAADGSNPHAGLIDMGGTLYGTTTLGGAYEHGVGGYWGTAFSIMTGGTETVLHSFGNGADGGWPAGGLIDVGGTLYGMTAYGGTYGNGTVFALTP